MLKSFLASSVQGVTKGVPINFSENGVKALKENFLLKFTKVNLEILSKYISEGDTVIDATVGNGYDTDSLLQLVGSTGKVYAFDIQEQAIGNAKKLLTQNNRSLHNIEFINDSHSLIHEYVNESVQAVVFNLGYLPTGDHNITTQVDTTLSAVEQSLELLEANGIISILIYSGHEQGKIEKERIIQFGESLDDKRYHVMMFRLMNQSSDPPCLMFITKNKGKIEKLVRK